MEAVSAGWVRIAWYATNDGSGGQTSTTDSPTVEGSDGVWTRVSTGAVQAPAGTRSARVRILVRPGGEPARLAADDVTFEETTTPVATPQPSPTPLATAAATPTASPTSAPAQTATPGSSASRPSAALAATPAGRVELVRITEVAPNPSAPGNDAAAEWVELTNYGESEVWLVGFAIEDAGGRTPLDLHLGPLATLVVAAPEAELGTAEDVLRVERIGNGLRNDGDVLRLVTPDGETIDEVRWGDAEGAELLPGVAASLERWFDLDGTLLGERIANDPTPGVRTLPPPDDAIPPREPAPEAQQSVTSPVATPPSAPSPAPAAPSTVGTGGTNFVLWLVLFTVGGVAVGGLAVYRAIEVLREGAPPRAGG